jgi:hypothetical protein
MIINCTNRNARFRKALADLSYGRPIMTCYFRHLAQVFKKAGIEVTPQNRREIDRIIHDILGVGYPNCPAAWRQVKTRVLEDEAGFVSALKEKWNNRK